MVLERWFNPLGLTFSGHDVVEETLGDAIRESPGVCHLVIANTSLTEDQLQPILMARDTLRLIQIESLNGDYPKFRISTRGADLLAQLSQLRVLTLFGCELDFSPARCFPAFPHLTALYLDASTFSEETFREFMSEWSFSTLSLRETEFTESMAESLNRQSRLETLYLSGARFDANSLRFLDAMKSLKEIRLTNTCIDGQVVARIQEALPNTTVYWQDVF